jgi:hypothetical protein
MGSVKALFALLPLGRKLFIQTGEIILVAYLVLQYNPLVKGILVGFLVSLLLFGGGIYVWRQLSTVELKVPANELTNRIIGDTNFSFVYHPDSTKLTIDFGEGGNDIPANTGFGGSWSWERYVITKVNTDYIILLFTPWRFSTIEDVMER